MSDQIREDSKWFREKGAVMREYVKGRTAVLSAVAGRGFLQMPGFLYDIENDLETDAKRKLSDINFAILQETIERELKQAGLAYDLSYRNLLMAWELRKQELMDSWEAELAGIKMDMAGKEAALSRLEIETASRGTILLTAKTEIEMQAESLRSRIAALADDTADYEVTLANQKLLTAQKKLEIIPILEQIVIKEQELLASELGKIPVEQELLTVVQATAAKKEELVPYLAELTTQTEEYGKELDKQTEIELDIAGQRILDAGISVQKAGIRVEEANARKSIEEKNLELLLARIDTENVRHGADEDVMEAQLDSQMTLNAEEKSTDREINDSDKATNEAVVAGKEGIVVINEDTQTTAADDRAWIRIHQIAEETDYRVEEIETIVDLEKNTKVTAALTHLLSM
jgi:hypothetical protein